MPTLSGARHHFVDVEGVAIHVAEFGEGEPLVLLHGFPQHWYAWHRVIPLLADRYRLICPDLAGCGWSDAPRGGYGTADRVRCLFGLLDALELGHVRLIGHEVGGWLALVAAFEHPERFRHLVAVNAVPPWTPRRRLAAHAWRNWYTGIVEQPVIGRVALRDCSAFTRLLLRRYATGRAWDPAVLEEFVGAMSEPGCARAAEIQHRRFVFEDIGGLAIGRYRHRCLTVPTLLLGGENDFFVPPTLLRGADQSAETVSVRIVAGAGHYLPEERPELVAELAAELFSDIRAPYPQGAS